MIVMPTSGFVVFNDIHSVGGVLDGSSVCINKDKDYFFSRKGHK